ncbi:MAG: replicative DNA helicase [Bacteroidales bacterium]|nr:replicative DNA helicase [Bacteroidales bacterium]
MATNSTRTRGNQPLQPAVLPDAFGTVPPQAVETEAALLGACLISPERIDDEINTLISPDTFYDPRHHAIYEAMYTLMAKGQPVDLFTVQEQLLTTKKLEEAGGVAYLTSLTTQVASAANLKAHARILAQKHIARRLIVMAMKVQQEAYQGTTDVDELLQVAESQIFEISSRQMRKDVVQIDSVVDEAYERIRHSLETPGSMSGVPSGFHALDHNTGGWQKSDLIVIAARPAMGKTAFVLSMAKNMAVDNKIPVAVFSLEMSNVQLVNRLIMNVCSLPGDSLRNGDLTMAEMKQLDAGIPRLMGAPLFVDDTPSLSVLELRTKARRLAREHGIQCIIIDYLQLMNATGMNFYSREQEVSLISRSLKGLAKELNIPIIALSQLNRNVESRSANDDKRPQLSDLRESGAIEQDADIVCFIHRPEYYKIYTVNDEDMRGKAQIIIAKHRSGSVEDITLKYVSSYTRFDNLNADDDVNKNNSSTSQTVDLPPRSSKTPLPTDNSGNTPF